MTNIIIREDWRHQSGGQYYYVKEENIHRRIEKYANFRGKYMSKRETIVEHTVLNERYLLKLPIICFRN
jgi:sarcosine oxidase delta subunit